MSQVRQDQKTIGIVEFEITQECQKQLLVKVFDFVSNILSNLVEFCDQLKKPKEIFKYKNYGTHLNNNPSRPV